MRPAPFMYALGVPCFASPLAPDSGLFVMEEPIGLPIVHLLSFDGSGQGRAHMKPQPTRTIVFASPSAWAEMGAWNLARAYLPEGVA